MGRSIYIYIYIGILDSGFRRVHRTTEIEPCDHHRTRSFRQADRKRFRVLTFRANGHLYWRHPLQSRPRSLFRERARINRSPLSFFTPPHLPPKPLLCTALAITLKTYAYACISHACPLYESLVFMGRDKFYDRYGRIARRRRTVVATTTDIF